MYKYNKSYCRLHKLILRVSEWLLLNVKLAISQLDNVENAYDDDVHLHFYNTSVLKQQPTCRTVASLRHNNIIQTLNLDTIISYRL